MKFAIYPYKIGSKSANSLAEILGCKQIKHEGSKFNKWNDPNYWVINYGSSHCPSGASVINSSLNVTVAGDKLKYFNLIKDYARIPEYTNDKEVAASWFDNSKLVVCRTILTGHSGSGIVLAESADELVDAPLYTKYVYKDSEWRLHFAFNHETPFFIQKKVRKSDYEGEPDNRIRHLSTGWNYAILDLIVPGDVLLQASNAFGHSNLDFGAIDCIYRKSTDKAYVLECNTAPGLQGTTLERYTEQFRRLDQNV